MRKGLLVKEMEKQAEESFRDHVGTIDEKGKRRWVYAQKPKGRLFNFRKLVTAFFLILFFGLPFIKVNGEPLFLLNILEGKFIIFGVIFWPQDFFLFGLGMIIFVLIVALFTVVFGRIFCGWACPQTIFMEIVFRRIEYWIEGNANQQKALNNGPWTNEKIRKKVVKNSIFYLLSLLIVSTLYSYIIGVDKLLILFRDPLGPLLGSSITLLVLSGIFFGVYARFREQVCLVVCPYGRLQGVLLDRDTMLVAYDYVRGDPRGHLKKGEERKMGDCIDCGLCERVCPGGIDIRNGTQLECVNCTACIDACNSVMDKIGKEPGLIRYASENGIANKQKLRFTPRMMAYTGVLVALIGLEIFLLASRTDLDITINRARGSLYQDQPGEKISNLYTIQLLNKTRNDLPVTLRLESEKGEIQVIGKPLFLGKEDFAQGTFFIMVDKSVITKRKTAMEIGVYSGTKKIKTVTANFLGPISR
jgi:cytochrome c oxidase accessory protein FixG